MAINTGAAMIVQLKRIRPVAISRGFTLLELLATMGIISILILAVAPAVRTMKSSRDIASAAYTITDTLLQARTYAIANNTYVWVGFYEESETATSPTNVKPPYAGAGKVLLAAVSSLDGTTVFQSGDPSTPLAASRIKQIGKLIRIDGIHLTDVGAPAGIGSDFESRPSAYVGQFGSSHYNRISSDETNGDKTLYPFTVQNYTFYKTIMFSPRGDANINSTYSPRNPGEIGVKPTHGATVDSKTRDVVAVQFGGFGGNFKIYRR